MSERLGKNDRILVKSGFYFPYDGKVFRRVPSFTLKSDEIGEIIDVVNDEFYNGCHLIVKLTNGVIDLCTSQDQFYYRRVKEIA